MAVPLRVEAVHHLNLLQIGVVHHFSLPTKIAQRLFLVQDSDDLS